MPSVLPEADMRKAVAAIDHARSVRRVHRRRSKRGDSQRESDIDVALNRLKSAMRPIRKHVGKFPYGPQTGIAERNRTTIRNVSKTMQAERRKLWKMKRRKENENGST